MTELYFVRHAEADLFMKNQTSILSDRGKEQRRMITDYFADKKIEAVYSAPEPIAVETVSDIALEKGLSILKSNQFRNFSDEDEAQQELWWYKYWQDFGLRIKNGESFTLAQARQIHEIEHLLITHENKKVVIGSHFDMIALVMNYYNTALTWNEVKRDRGKNPFVEKLVYEGVRYVRMEQVEVY